MKNQGTQLISTRLDRETLKKIDEMADTHFYWKRSTIINEVLKAVFRDFTPGARYDMVRSDMYLGYQRNATYEITQHLISKEELKNG